MADSNADQGQDPQENDGICPYMFEPNKNDSNNEQLSYSDDDSTSTGEDSYSSDDSFEEINAWRRTDLNWCKCGKCDLMAKARESFCCHEKAVEYDEYDSKLSAAQSQGFNCITSLSSFVNNILTEDVLCVDVAQYLEDNWPLGDDELAQKHKLYRHVAYQRCSRWIFEILGKKCRRVFPSCVYKCIRDKFASPDGIYTHFKLPK